MTLQVMVISSQNQSDLGSSRYVYTTPFPILESCVMARVFPEHLPQSIIDDPLRKAERSIYEQLGKLSDKFTAYYSVPWQSHLVNSGVIDGEADFVIVHPDMGIVILEVKGGNISFDPTENQWFTTGGIKIKDPLDQGRKNHYALLDKLQALPGWDKNRYINIGHAVSFPSVFVKEKTLKPDLSRDIILDKADLDELPNAITRIFNHLFGKNIRNGAPGSDRIQIIEKLLACSFQLRTPLGVEIEFEDNRLIELTDTQMMALSFLGDRKRVAISGCAGSGKTMLAIEKAMQLHELGLNVLLTCFNISLANHLRNKLSGKEITILNFHDLAKEIIGQTGFRVRSSKNEGEYYDTILPEALLEAAEETGPIFDAIIVDEGQDFQENYWIALSGLLKSEGYLYIFFDDNQNLYGGAQNFMGLITEQPFSLNQNCRNTKSIHNAVIKFHNNPNSIVCKGPDGRPPELISYETEDEFLRLVQSLINKLVNEEHVRASDIAIITPRSQEKSILKSGKRLGNFILTTETPKYPNEILATSIHKFKGLERRVIILGEIDNRFNYHADMVMYVGCSRARTQLYILHGKAVSSQLVRLQSEN